MALNSGDDGDRMREICTELEDVRHHIRGLELQMQDARSARNVGEFISLLDRRATYLEREAELEKELETKFNFFYRRFL
ncbi:hypothetical protein H5410_048723 [Solanum commersonii]|uniref:Uncharacterized protein n=1 Tax=Solanum commersonii TaxID=4109 RepID=A0A9J5XIY6_SOLCO|nr:hypothetical protein H5410_048723 [Solanum commersonii]